ncbi:MAG: trypsin-like peptidase domain-containing protein [Deltaproteobacteria bacterium]|nr:trypsin-like peptidase domain-containing protein [Deltaproteobacteria bacterium]
MKTSYCHVVFAATALMLSSGCGPLPDMTTDEAEGKGEAAVTAAYPTVGHVLGDSGNASGVLVAHPRMLLTAYHVCYKPKLDAKGALIPLRTAGGRTVYAGERDPQRCTQVRIGGQIYTPVGKPYLVPGAGFLVYNNTPQAAAKTDLVVLTLDRPVAGVTPQPLPTHSVQASDSVLLVGFYGCGPSNDLPCRVAGRISKLDWSPSSLDPNAYHSGTFSWPVGDNTPAPGNSGGLVVAASNDGTGRAAPIAGIFARVWYMREENKTPEQSKMYWAQALAIAPFADSLREIAATLGADTTQSPRPANSLPDEPTIPASQPPTTPPANQPTTTLSGSCNTAAFNRCGLCGWQFCYQGNWMPCAPASDARASAWCSELYGPGTYTCATTSQCEQQAAATPTPKTSNPSCTPGTSRGCTTDGATREPSCGAQWCLDSGKWSSQCSYNWRRNNELCGGRCDQGSLRCQP